MLADNFECERNRTVCFSGHRPEKLPDRGDERSQTVRMLKSMLYKEISDSVNEGFNCFVTGLARGVDLWAGEIVLELKAKNSGIRLVAAAPYRGHGSSFKGADKFILGNILRKADEVVYVSESYSKECMRLRNEYMVNCSGKLIAVVSDYRSGTGQTIRYAKQQGLATKIIDAEALAAYANSAEKYDKLAF
ncbi:MAG: DUF1273 family protein [Oscillospiraceae bacterium]|nr:DUF1273 family protein [Oscillospiraceae bacterium]